MAVGTIPSDFAERAQAFLLDESNYLVHGVLVATLLLVMLAGSQKPATGEKTGASLLAISTAFVLYASAPYLASKLPVLQASNDFSTFTVLPLDSKIPFTSTTPVYGDKIPLNAGYQYSDFYTANYVAAHQMEDDVILHVALFLTTAFLMITDTRLTVPWLMSLTAGVLVTRPVLMMSVQVPWVEATVTTFVGLLLAYHYKALRKFALLFALWTSIDAGSHWYYGLNFDYALWTGRHFLSWGLYGQGQLAISYCRDVLYPQLLQLAQ